MYEEFKKFAMRGNVIDLAVGVIIGAAFTGIVNSLVRDVVMPPIGWALGGLDFTNFFLVLKGSAPAATLKAAPTRDRRSIRKPHPVNDYPKTIHDTGVQPLTKRIPVSS